MSFDLPAEVLLGEDCNRQFKADIRNGDSLAAEMAVFANTNGGDILIGVADDGSLPGLSRDDVTRINQLIGNTASQLVRSPLTVQTKNVALPNGQVAIVLSVPKGIDKPYFDRNGIIWLKAGADKRRVNSKEELRRLFQLSGQFHADELTTRAGIDRLDKLRFRDFLRDVHNRDFPDDSSHLIRLLQNMNLATDEGVLNLAGVLLFAEQPELIKPQFVVKAICYPGNEIHSTDYVDTEDFAGALPKIFSDAQAFVMRKPVEELDLVEVKPAALKSGGAIGSAIGGAMDMTDRQKEIISIIRDNSKISYRAVASMLEINESAVIKHLNALKHKGVLKRIGGTRGHWEVLKMDDEGNLEEP